MSHQPLFWANFAKHAQVPQDDEDYFVNVGKTLIGEPHRALEKEVV
jgi:hypothetical protein